MMFTAFVVMFVWLIWLSLKKNLNIIPLFQMFGGAGFALIQSGGVAYVNQHAPGNWEPPRRRCAGVFCQGWVLGWIR